MADEEKKEEEKGEGESKKKGGSMIVVLLLVVIVLLLGGGGAAFFLLSGGDDDEGKSSAKETVASTIDDKMGPTMPLKSFVVNLAEPGGSRYLKLSIEIELRRPLNEEEAKLSLRVRDRMLVYLGSLRVKDVQTREGKVQLKKKLVKEANQAYGGRVVKAAYFREFVIQ